MPTEIEYLMNPYLSDPSYSNPFQNFLYEKEILNKLQEINNRLDKITKVSPKYGNN